MRLIMAMLLLLTLLLVGCVNTIALYPINGTDFFFIKSGTTIDNITTAQDGYFLANSYMKEVVKIRVK
jgi:PBP1b-binding outer membrane lipoprotein LpoB